MSIDLSFKDLKEKERTKHVHRLHPYKGKFIPQLVEYFLKEYFKPGQLVLDPFSGSGTTLVQAKEMGVNSIGVDISGFNCALTEAKVNDYNIDILSKTVNYLLSQLDNLPKDIKHRELSFINKWYSKNIQTEIFQLHELIKPHNYYNLLRIVLSRAMRSCRATTHYNLGTLKEPVFEPYYCHKHKKTCKPVESIIPFFKRYLKDTLKRVTEYISLCTEPSWQEVIQADSRLFRIHHQCNGIITSPPYLGLINYHEQHEYAYELFNIPRYDDSEIGAKFNGVSKRAQQEYKDSMIQTFKRCKTYLRPNANVFVVVNDKLDLYPEIIEQSGFKQVNKIERNVHCRSERDRKAYSESILHIKRS